MTHGSPLSDSGTSYALATGAQDEVRLTLLNELHNPYTLSKMSIFPGARILTIGCGIGLLELEMALQTTADGFVLGTDISAEQIVIAKRNRDNSSLAVDHVQFLHRGAFEIEDDLGTFDRIHCRYVLTHLPWEKVVEIIPRIHQRLAPGGMLLMEELATIDTLFCDPPHPGYDQWKATVRRQLFSQKSDPSPGLRIREHIEKQGYAFSYSSYQTILGSSREKSILSLGVLSARQRLLQEQLCSQAEIDEILCGLCDLEQDLSYLPRYNEVSQIIVRR